MKFEDEKIKNLSNKYGKSPGQIILNWHIRLGVIPIPGTSKIGRMKENLEALKFEMTDEDIQDLSKYFEQKKSIRFCGCKRFFGVNLFA